MEALDYAYCSSFLSAIDTDKNDDSKQITMTSPDSFSPHNITPSPQDILNGAYGSGGPLSDDDWSLNRLMASNDNDMMPSLVESRHSTGSSSISIASPTGSLGGNVQSYPYDNVNTNSNPNYFPQSYTTGDNIVNKGLSPNSIVSSASPGGNSYFSSHGSSDSDTYAQNIIMNNGDNLWTTDQFGSFEKGVFGNNQGDMDIQLQQQAQAAQVGRSQQSQVQVDADVQAQYQTQLQSQSQLQQQYQSSPYQEDQPQLQSQQQSRSSIKQEEMSDDDADDEDLDRDLNDLNDLDYEEPNFKIKQESVSPKKSNSRSNSYSGSISSPPQKPQPRRANTKSNKVTKPKKEKTSHNMIEKRYRTNINDKIHALRDCVPSLCYALDGVAEKDDLEGLTPASKLNKATILVKATEYIKHLQKKNEMLAKELERFKSNSGTDSYSSSTSYRRRPRVATTPMTSMTPESRSSSLPSTVSSSSGMMPKAMMATMAGIMGTNMILGNNGDVSSLSALPGLAFLNTTSYGGIQSGVILMNILKSMLIIGVVWNILFSYTEEKDGLEDMIFDDDIMNNPKSLKQHTWLTTSQQLIIPTGNSLLPALPSLLLVVGEIIISTLIGVDGYLLISQSLHKSITPNDSIIRAMDSQLCGGDELCDRYRIFYMFLKGFVMAPISKRYIYQAIQARLLFVGFFAPFGVKISEFLWKRALTLAENDLKNDDSNSDSDLLPNNFINLLNCSDVFDDEMMKTLDNLSFNKSRAKESITSSNSILDIVSQLYAERKIHELLISSLESGDSSSDSYFIDNKSLDFIDSVSSEGSDAKQNVAIIRGLYNGSDVKNVMDLLLKEYSTVTVSPTVTPEEPKLQSQTQTLYTHSNSSEETLHPANPKIDQNTKLLLTNNSSIAMHCTIINHYLEAGQINNAIDLVHKLAVQQHLHKMALLGFISLWKILIKLYELKQASGDLKVEKLSALARIWIGSDIAEYEGINLEKRRELVGLSVEMNLYFGGLNP